MNNIYKDNNKNEYKQNKIYNIDITSSIIIIIEIESIQMDLPYPTIKNHSPNNDLNHLDKLARSILLSTHEIPKQQCINKNIKSKILKIISIDNARKLHKFLQKQVIGFDIQIGTRGSRWNILHFCAKNNAYQCIQYILKSQYQYCPQQYKKLLNQKTIQGYTILIISIINRSQKVLQLILQFGGVDIHVLDQNKISAYEIALNYKNDKAIRLLMSYESKSKKRQFINKQLLNMPIIFPMQSFCHKFIACLFGCVTFGYYQMPQTNELKEEKNKFKVSDFVIDDEYIDYVPINSKKQLRGYDIQWKRATQLMVNKISIFESYNPFEILQSNFTIKNNLIIFQCLSQQPWLIRRLIRPDRCRNNYYNVFLYPKRMLEKQNIDDYIPFIKDRKQAMFLSSQQQMWPMLLQKALAKYHGSYFALTQIQPRILLEQLTGFPTIQIDLTQILNQNIISFLQQLSAKNYLFMLKGKDGTDLCVQKGKIQCFTVLNFYQKSNHQLILVNCPFISQKWKQQQRHEPLALKLIKGHYNTHKQMCIWIEANKIKDYFKSIIISLSFIDYERSELKIKTKQLVFFKFKVQNKRDQNIYIQLSNIKNGIIYDLSQLQIIKNQGKQLFSAGESEIKSYDKNLGEIQCLPGQFMCHFQIQKTQQAHALLLLCWSADTIQPQFVQSELGILQWLGFLKNHFYKVLGQFSLILFRQATNNIILFRVNIQTDLIIQGTKDNETGFVQMIAEQNIHYCVLNKIIKPQQIIFDYKNKNL